MDKPVHILVVDDEESFTFFVKLNLQASKHHEFKVTTANSGEEGLKLARTLRPDLILLDIMMPEMCGTEVAEKLLLDPRTKNIPIIFITAVVQKDEVAEKLLLDPRTKNIPIIFITAVVQKDEVAEEAGMMGGREFIAKPVSREELISRIEATLNL